MRKVYSSLRGFTLIELMLTFGILAFCLCGILLTYINMFIISDLSRDFTLATNALQAKMEEVKEADFDSLSVFNGDVFDLDGFTAANAEGVIAVSDIAYSDLKRIRIIASFRSRNRVVGEDQNLNGVLNAGEDANNNGRLDSPAEMVTLIAR